MFLVMLVFFGPFILGALLNQALMTGRQRTASMGLKVIAICLAYLFLAFGMPFRNLWLELLYAMAGTAAVASIMMFFPLKDRSPRVESRLVGALFVATIILWPIVTFTLTTRVYRAQQIAVILDGVISQKYRGDHNAPSFVITQPDGTEMTFESVDLPAWNAAIEHQSHLRKPAWSAFGELDGKPTRIVPQRGGLPD